MAENGLLNNRSIQLIIMVTWLKTTAKYCKIGLVVGCPT